MTLMPSAARWTAIGGRAPLVRRVRVDHDERMGSDGGKARKPRRRQAKVPKYEEPNRLEGASGGSGFGRSGHGSDHHRAGRPGRVGSYVLRLLGQRPKQ